MNIAFDVDGVLWDIEAFQRKYGEPYFFKKEKALIQRNGFGIREMFHCSEGEEKLFWLLYLPQMLMAKVREHGKEVIRDLKQRGHTIFIITSRAKTTESSLLGTTARMLLKNWLKRNGIVYDGIFFCDDSNAARRKDEVCKKLAVDVMVEDRWENIELLKSVTRVIGFRTCNNRDYQDASVVFVHSFPELKKELEKIEQNFWEKKK